MAMLPHTLILASTNAHKVAELREMMSTSRLPIAIDTMHSFGDPPSIEETAPDFAGNARLKSEGIAGWLQSLGHDIDRHWVLADDSGLCVDALDGAPGVYSARYAGVGASDAQNNAKLVHELQSKGIEKSPAAFHCVLSLTCVHTLKSRLFKGVARGHAQIKSEGAGGFGYDPHVWLDGQSQSFAQMDRVTKAKHSHRGHALTQLMQALPDLLNPVQ